MNKKKNVQSRRLKFDDKSTSDVIVKLTSDEGRDDLFYCHCHVLTQKSHYFSTLLSKNLNCIELNCLEHEVNAHVSTLRLLYSWDLDTWHGVSHTLGILLAAHRLGCHEICRACVAYLEAAPWDEAEEEEILRSVPLLGPNYYSILSRILPVDPSVICNVFASAVSFATSRQSSILEAVKRSVQEQMEYLLTEDDDSPVIPVKTRVKDLVGGLLTRFNSELTLGQNQGLVSLISDVCWVSQMMTKMEMMREVVCYWADRAETIVAAIEGLPNGPDQIEARVKVIEVIIRVLEAFGSGSVILLAEGRLRVVNTWLPFVQQTRQMVDFCNGDDEAKVDFELWESLESALVLTLLTLPSGDLAEVLTGWLRGEQVQYPDLTEAFEVWCYRSKAARRRFGLDGVPFRGPK